MGKNLKFHFVKLSYVLCLIRGLQDNGVNVARILKKSTLRYFRLDDPELMIPVLVAYDFVEKVRYDQGIEQIAKTFVDYFHFEAIGTYADLFFSSEKLISSIQNAIKYEGTALSHEQLIFKINGKTSYLGNSFIGDACQGRSFFDQIDLIHQFNILKIAHPDGWAPMEIHITDHDTSIAEHFFPNGNFKIVTGQEKFGWVLETSSLANPLMKTGIVENPIEQLSPVPSNFSDRVKLILEGLSSNYLPTLVQVADILNVSQKTVKRMLAKEGETFSEILANWRFTKAIELLTKSDLKIHEISNELHYSSPSSFIRAFNRWTGLNPMYFR